MPRRQCTGTLTGPCLPPKKKYLVITGSSPLSVRAAALSTGRVSTGGVTTTFSYDANGALVKKEDPTVGAHYEVLDPA